MGIKKKKISEFPLAETLVGLFTIGVDKLNRSVKVGLEFLKTAAENAENAARSANTARQGIEERETQRIADEKKRVASEKARAEAEASRASAEQTRATADRERTSSEQSRIDAEELRSVAETIRQTAEAERVDSELVRVTAEEKRQTDTAAAIRRVDDAARTTFEFVLARMPTKSHGYNHTDGRYHFRVVIGNFRSELLDSSRYRLCYMYTRRAYRFNGVAQRYLKWVVPMFGGLLSIKDVAVDATYVPITGRENDVMLFSRGINTTNDPLYTSTDDNTRFRLTNNTRWKTGIAVFKYTGEGNPGWYRCSNIFGLELSIGNRKLEDLNMEHINTSFIVE